MEEQRTTVLLLAKLSHTMMDVAMMTPPVSVTKGVIAVRLTAGGGLNWLSFV